MLPNRLLGNRPVYPRQVFPVVQPTMIEMGINLKTAKAFGLTMSDEVIE